MSIYFYSTFLGHKLPSYEQTYLPLHYGTVPFRGTFFFVELFSIRASVVDNCSLVPPGPGQGIDTYTLLYQLLHTLLIGPYSQQSVK